MKSSERVVVCVDDTDDLTKETSTGAVAEAIVQEAMRLGGRVELGITRHQLLLDPRVPYTSHNSSMAFGMRLPVGALDELRERAVETICRMRAADSDPGLCTARVPREEDAHVAEVIAFGERAQREVIAKEEACELACRVPWLELSEHGGDGSGVIGALAGVGLRLGGRDGRFRGTFDLAALCVAGAQTTMRVAELRRRLSARLNGQVRVADVSGVPCDAEAPVALGVKAKAVYFAHALVIVVREEGGTLVPCGKDEFKQNIGAGDAWRASCPFFVFDNDIEEYVAPEDARVCANCLYRRMGAGGFSCVRDQHETRVAREAVRA